MRMSKEKYYSLRKYFVAYQNSREGNTRNLIGRRCQVFLTFFDSDNFKYNFYALKIWNTLFINLNK